MEGMEDFTASLELSNMQTSQCCLQRKKKLGKLYLTGCRQDKTTIIKISERKWSPCINDRNPNVKVLNQFRSYTFQHEKTSVSTKKSGHLLLWSRVLLPRKNYF